MPVPGLPGRFTKIIALKHEQSDQPQSQPEAQQRSSQSQLQQHAQLQQQLLTQPSSALVRSQSQQALESLPDQVLAEGTWLERVNISILITCVCSTFLFGCRLPVDMQLLSLASPFINVHTLFTHRHTQVQTRAHMYPRTQIRTQTLNAHAHF